MEKEYIFSHPLSQYEMLSLEKVKGDFNANLEKLIKSEAHKVSRLASELNDRAGEGIIISCDPPVSSSAEHMWPNRKTYILGKINNVPFDHAGTLLSRGDVFVLYNLHEELNVMIPLDSIKRSDIFIKMGAPPITKEKGSFLYFNLALTFFNKKILDDIGGHLKGNILIDLKKREKFQFSYFPMNLVDITSPQELKINFYFEQIRVPISGISFLDSKKSNIFFGHLEELYKKENEPIISS